MHQGRTKWISEKRVSREDIDEMEEDDWIWLKKKLIILIEGMR